MKIIKEYHPAGVPCPTYMRPVFLGAHFYCKTQHNKLMVSDIGYYYEYEYLMYYLC